MKRIVILLALVLVLALAACASPDGTYTLQLPSDGVRVDLVNPDGSVIPLRVVMEGDGAQVVIRIEAVNEVPATPVPTLSATNTPRPTPTYAPSDTPQPPTNVPQATPTIEVSVVPPTPAPTVAPPDETICKAGVAASTLNIRAEPMISGVRVGQLTLSARVEVTELHIVHAEGRPNREEWARIDKGWIAIWYGGAVLAVLDDTEPCWNIPKTYEEDALPVTALLWHVVPGANRSEMAATYAILKGKGIPFGIKAVNEPDACREAVAAGGVCIYRSVHPGDCPNVLNTDATREALVYLTSLRPYLQQDTRATYFEVVNECNFDDPGWWNSFMLETIRLARLWSWPPLVLPTWNPGRPELADLDTLKPALVALRDAGGMIGMHAYSITRDTPLCEVNPWLSFRHRTVRAHLDTMGLADLRIVITEAARAAGDMTPDETDFVCWYHAVQHDKGLFGVSLWTAGHTEAWSAANLNGHMLAIAKGV